MKAINTVRAFANLVPTNRAASFVFNTSIAKALIVGKNIGKQHINVLIYFVEY